MKSIISLLLLIALPALAGDLTTGHQFSPNEQVTDAKLNSSVNDAEINGNAIGTAELADAAVTVPKLQGVKSVAGGRLTLTSGTPVPSGNVAAATTLYYTPYLHNEIAVYDGAKWLLKTFTERSVAVPGTANRNYDVFLYLNAGTLTLDVVAWSNSGFQITNASNASPIVITANGHGLTNGDEVYINGVLGNTNANGTWIVASATTNTFALTASTGNSAYTSGGWLNARDVLLTRQDGVLVKSGAPTWRYLGSIRTVAAGQTEDSTTKRFVWNYNNRISRLLYRNDSTSSWTYGTIAFRQARAEPTNKVELLTGICEEMLDLSLVVGINVDPGEGVAVGIGIDSLTVPSSTAVGGATQSGSSAIALHVHAGYVAPAAAGYHNYNWLERINAGTVTFYGLSGDYTSGLTGRIDL